MRYLSLFSGIEAATVAWKPLGWECVAVAEIEAFPSAVLAHYYPTIPNLGDVTQITEAQVKALGPIDVVVGGSPCQDLSVAGKRAGLAGARSGLFHEQVRIFDAARKHCGARFLLWENVPGAFSSHQGRDFAVVVGDMAGVADVAVPPKGWGTEGCIVGEKGMVEWAVLDAQWFGVPQRRRRVFALLDSGDWAGRPPVLLEPQGLRGDSAPRREAGQGIANSLTERPDRGGGNSEGQRLIPETVGADGFDASEDGTGRGTPLTVSPVAFAQNQRDEVRTMEVAGAIAGEPGMKQQTYVAFSAKDHGADVMPTVAFAIQERAICENPNAGPDGKGVQEGVAYTLEARTVPQAAATGSAVRRLTPRECERLQGFPDDYTLIPYRNKPAADGPRYKALGNSMAVPVMRWIGERIAATELFL